MVGDIVLVPLSFTDFQGAKSRPVLVVADVGMRDWVVCQITSHNPGRSGEVAITQNDTQAGHIIHNSWVRPGRLWTLNQQLFSRPVAQVAANKLAEVLTVIRSLF